MAITGRLLCLVLLAAGFGGACSLLAPQVATDLGLDWWNLRELCRQQERERQRAALLEKRDGVLLERIKNRKRVTDGVIVGNVTLLEAAAWFRRYSRNSEYPDTSLDQFKGATEEEKLCRQVISWVEADLDAREGTPDRSVLRRLEAELQGHLECDGVLELPD